MWTHVHTPKLQARGVIMASWRVAARTSTPTIVLLSDPCWHHRLGRRLMLNPTAGGRLPLRHHELPDGVHAGASARFATGPDAGGGRRRRRRHAAVRRGLGLWRGESPGRLPTADHPPCLRSPAVMVLARPAAPAWGTGTCSNSSGSTTMRSSAIACTATSPTGAPTKPFEVLARLHARF